MLQRIFNFLLHLCYSTHSSFFKLCYTYTCWETRWKNSQSILPRATLGPQIYTSYANVKGVLYTWGFRAACQSLPVFLNQPNENCWEYWWWHWAFWAFFSCSISPSISEVALSLYDYACSCFIFITQIPYSWSSVFYFDPTLQLTSASLSWHAVFCHSLMFSSYSCFVFTPISLFYLRHSAFDTCCLPVFNICILFSVFLVLSCFDMLFLILPLHLSFLMITLRPFAAPSNLTYHQM